MEHPEYEHPPVTMKEFLTNPFYTPPEDNRRPFTQKILCEIFDKGNFETLGDYEEVLWISGIGCHAKGTRILMCDGTVKNVEDIRVGDKLMGDDSTSRTVLELKHGKDVMYKITPIKGNPFTVNGEHILSLKRTSKGIIAKNGRRDHLAGTVVNISVNKFLQLSKKMKGILKLYRATINFNYNSDPLPIDPYFLGYWLGNGNRHNVGITTQDTEIKDVIYNEASKLELKVTINQNTNKTCPTYTITTGINGGKHDRNILLEKFRKCNLLNNKHIPLAYKTSSRKQRLQLLAGLIDSDGDKKKGCNSISFSNKNELLMDDVIYLCRSLGLAAYKSGRWTSCRGKRFYSFRISISGELSHIPTKLKRKQCGKRKQIKNVLYTGFRVEKLGADNYYGFTLDANGLYLMGDFTITHNSGKSFCSSKSIHYMAYRLLCLKSPQEYFKFGMGTRIAFINISKSYSQAKDVVFGEIKNRIDNSPWFQKYYPPDPRIKSLIRLPKNLYILPVGSNEEAPLGYNIFGAVIDEASFHIITKDKDYAAESYNQIKKRIRSRFLSKGKLFIITSPRYTYDFAEKKFSEDISPTLYKRRTPLWEALPPEYYGGKKFDLVKYLPTYKTWTKTRRMVPIEYEDEFRQNPEKAMRDYGAQPSLAIQGLFRDPAVVSSAANKERKHPINPATNDFYEWFFNPVSSPNYDREPRYIHVDLGLNRDGKGDKAGLSVGCFRGWQEFRIPNGRIERRPKIFIDLIEQIKAGPKGEILFSDIRKKIYRLREIGYSIALVSCDGWNCNLGSNKVKLLCGTEKRIDEIISPEWIYAYDLQKREIVPALCRPRKKTGIKVPVLEVSLDNGEKVHFTPEHLVLMRDGSYKMVRDLKNGDSLMPLYTKYYKRNTKSREIQRYERILQIGTNKWEMTHDMVTKNINRPKPKDYVVHHKNFNSEDNRPINLQYCHIKSHIKLHKELSDLRWRIPGEREKQSCWMREMNKKCEWSTLLKPPTKETAKKIGKTIKKLWENLEYRKHMQEVHKGQVCYWKGKRLPQEVIEKIRKTKTGRPSPRKGIFLIPHKRRYCQCGCGQSKIMSIHEKWSYLRGHASRGRESHLKGRTYEEIYGIKRANEKKRKMSLTNRIRNHKVISIQFYGYEDVYDIEVPHYHNFGLSAGIFVHNSVDMLQTLKDAGIKAETLSVDRDTQPYYTMKAAILEGRLDFYPYAPFIKEAQQLEEVDGRKVDHPFNGGKDCCLAGNTGIRLLDGTTQKIKNLIGKSFEVYSCGLGGRLRIGKATNVVNTGVREDMLKVVLDNGQSVECTYNHPFMLRDGTYKRADSLKVGDSLMPLHNYNRKIVSIEKISPQIVYDMTVEKYSNFAIAAGVFVHNSDAVAGVCYHCSKRIPGSGVLGA